ncbi:MAG: hypothetical protein NTU49_08020 [Gammaproteobacteria bacterium]|nr:hypothetical protein [Gammaproteobacteria bacterium]
MSEKKDLSKPKKPEETNNSEKTRGLEQEPNLELLFEGEPDSPDELKELIEKYNESVQELIHQREESNDHKEVKHFHELTHELQSELIHLEELQRRAHESESERNAHFFQHHAEVIHHINEHWHHMQAHLDSLFEEYFLEECEEILELKHRIKHLLEALVREKEEAEYEHLQHKNTAPHPTPSGHHGPEKDHSQ